MRAVVWIDYDHSGTFDQSEFTALTGTTGGGGHIFTGTIAIPATALTGVTAVRVRNLYGTAWTGTEACSATTYGETEDYSINIDFPLSIGLVDFTAKNINDRNLIEWRTESEASGDFFILERSVDGSNFIPRVKVNAIGEASGYIHWDESPLPGINHYRLNLQSPGMPGNYSKIVSVKNELGSGFTVEAYPNPATDKLYVSVYGQQGADPAIIITDITGKSLYEGPCPGGNNEIKIDKFAPGTYMLRYKDGNNNKAIKIFKQ